MRQLVIEHKNIKIEGRTQTKKLKNRRSGRITGRGCEPEPVSILRKKVNLRKASKRYQTLWRDGKPRWKKVSLSWVWDELLQKREEGAFIKNIFPHKINLTQARGTLILIWK